MVRRCRRRSNGSRGCANGGSRSSVIMTFSARTWARTGRHSHRPSQIAAASAGRAFFLRRQLEHLVAEEIRQAIARCIADSHRLLSAAARATATLDIQPPSIHRRAAKWSAMPPIWSRATVRTVSLPSSTGCGTTCRRSGFDYERTGPWAPCSFADFSLGSADDERRIGHERNTALADLLDRALNKGVVLWGEATISLAGIDLMYVGLKVLVSSFETSTRSAAT